MTHKKKMLRLNRYIQFKLIESYENGKNPLYVKDVAKKRRASVYQVKLAGKRACKKVPFPTIRLFDLKFPSEFKPIIGWQPVDENNKIEWFEDNEKRKAQSDGIKEVHNEQVKKAREVKLITEKKGNQLLLPM